LAVSDSLDFSSTYGIKVVASDIIYLVNYVLKGGAAPCDACTLVPEVWGCF